MYSDLKLDHRVGSFLHQPMQDLLRETSVCLSQLRKKSPESMVIYTQLVSGFSLLFRTNPPSDTTHKSKYASHMCHIMSVDMWMYIPLFRSVKVLKLLIDMFCCDDALHVAVSNPSMVSNTKLSDIFYLLQHSTAAVCSDRCVESCSDSNERGRSHST